MTPFEFIIYTLAGIGLATTGYFSWTFARARVQEWQDQRIPKGWQPRKGKRRAA